MLVYTNEVETIRHAACTYVLAHCCNPSRSPESKNSWEVDVFTQREMRVVQTMLHGPSPDVGSLLQVWQLVAARCRHLVAG